MKALLEYFENLPDWPKVVTCLLLSGILGMLDYITGDFSLALFYATPIAIASWFIGKRSGYLIAML